MAVDPAVHDFSESKGWLYAAQICYVVVQKELRSHHRFRPIGCDRYVCVRLS